jgi:hypothetical protein
MPYGQTPESNPMAVPILAEVRPRKGGGGGGAADDDEDQGDDDDDGGSPRLALPQAGDVVIFTEGITHNAFPVRTPSRRRSLFFNWVSALTAATAPTEVVVSVGRGAFVS